MSDKRKSRRIATPDALAVKDPETRVTIGFLCDISVGGMLITGKGPFVIDKPQWVMIMLPSRIMGTRHLELEAICRWRTKSPSRGGFNAGYEFAALTPEQQLLIALLETEYVVRTMSLEETAQR